MAKYDNKKLIKNLQDFLIFSLLMVGYGSFIILFKYQVIYCPSYSFRPRFRVRKGEGRKGREGKEGKKGDRRKEVKEGGERDHISSVPLSFFLAA